MKSLRLSTLATAFFATSFLYAQQPGPAYQPGLEPKPATIVEASNEGQEAIAKFRLPAGAVVTLVAAEPLLANPVAIEAGADGRIYVAETFRQETEGVPDNRTFPEWLQDDLRLQTVEERAEMTLRHHPEFATEWTDREDRVRVLLDDDGDGVADRAEVFAHGFSGLVDGTGSGLLAHGSDVYYTCIPKLWRLEDADRDGVAESGEALHHGYGVRVAFRGHDMHGLVLGPMRKLYFSIGDRGYHVMTQEGELLTEPGRGAVFRCNLDGSELEVFARGLRNPQELAFDDFGHLFTGDNNCDAGDRARLVHLQEGSDSGWSMNFQYLPDRGPWMSEGWWKPLAEQQDLPLFLNAPLANLASGPSGLAAYPGVGLGPEMEGSFFLCDFLGGSSYSGIRRFTVQPKGASYAFEQQEEFWWGMLVTDVCFAPDGSMLASDWVSGWVGDGKGRIYRATFPDADSAAMAHSAATLAKGFSDFKEKELRELLQNPDRRLRFGAQWELVDRGDLATLQGAAIYRTPNPPRLPLLTRLHGAWGLGMLLSHPTAEVAEGAAKTLFALLADREAQVREQALRALQEGKASFPQDLSQSQAVQSRLLDDSLAVRRAAALLLGRWAAEGSFDGASLLAMSLNHPGPMDRALLQGVALAMSRAMGEQEILLSASTVAEQKGVRLATVLALRHQRSATLAHFLEDADPLVAKEAAIAIYDLAIADAMPALAASLASHPQAPFAWQRRALAANNLLGRAEDASRILDYVLRKDLDERLRKEAQAYIHSWDRPKEFDPIQNQSRQFSEERATDWFVGKTLPFTTAAEEDRIARGKDIFTGHALAQCTRCHSVRGVTPAGRPNPAGPDLSGIGLKMTEAELRKSILDPTDTIADGFRFYNNGELLPISAMPANMDTLLSEEELGDLVRYLAAQKQERKILVHVESAGYEHEVARADESGLSLVEKQWQLWEEQDHRFAVTIDRSADRFSAEGLAEFDAVFFYTTGELAMNQEQRQALMTFLEEGGVFAGAHCATDTFYEWPEYGNMIGAYFNGHPWHQEVALKVEDPIHPSTRLLPQGFRLTDEIYQFRAPYDRDNMHVLLSLDVTSVSLELDSVKRTDQDFAVSWERPHGKGGVFYTSLGHRPAIWKSPWFRDHLVDGILAVCDQPPTLQHRGDGAVQELPGGQHIEFQPITMPDGNTIWMSTTEITWPVYDLFFLREAEQEEADGISGPSRSVFPVTRGWGHDGIPALGMTYQAAQEFARWLSLRTEHVYRLPSEAEWQAAADAAVAAAPQLAEVAWHEANADGQPHQVASKSADANGLYDLFGNVAEWVVAEDVPKGVVRGGSFLDPLEKVGATARAPYHLDWQKRDPQWPKSSWWMSDGGFVGFRIVTTSKP